MTRTVTLLENAIEGEARLLLDLISKIQFDDICVLASIIEASPQGPEIEGSFADIVHVARNIKNLNAAYNNFYVV